MISSASSSALFLSETVPGPAALRFARCVAGILVTIFIVLVPFVRIPLTPVGAFIPSYEYALATVELLTALLLFGQYVHGAGLRLLILALAYLFNALITVVHLLSFPGAFGPTGVIGGGPQTTAWLYVFWHLRFIAFALVYACMHEKQVVVQPVSLAGLCFGVAAIISAVIAIAMLCTLGHDFLPKVIEAGNYSALIEKGITPSLVVACFVVLGILYRRHKISVLDMWLATVMIAWALDILMSAVFGSSRYDLGWYAGRLFGLTSGLFILGILLWEGNALYRNLITALREAQNSALDAEASRTQMIRAQRLEAIGQLTGGIAHDFNNVLQVISASLSLLQMRVKGNETAENLVARSLKSVRRGARLAHELLSFARRQPLRPRVIDVSRLIDTLSETFKRTLGDQIVISSQLGPSLANIVADPALLENALLNLVINARDAMLGAGTVKLGAVNETPESLSVSLFPDVPIGHYVRLFVADTGIGISADVLAHVFEPFFTTKPVDQGTGLGLSMVHGFVKQSAGHIAINSVPGEGTTVSIFLAATNTPVEHSRELVTALLFSSDATESILVVDDHSDVRASAVEILLALGYRVEQAHDAKSAIAVLEAGHTFDLLFSDIVMPGPVRTIDMVNRARQIYPKIAVLYTSGYTNDLIEKVGINTDSPDLISKPYEAFELAAKVRKMLQQPHA